MKYIYNEGGHREDATGDCATRAISIATGVPYEDVLKLIQLHAQWELHEPKSDGLTHTKLSAVTWIMRRLGWTFVDSRKEPLELSDENWNDGFDYVLWMPWHFTAVKDGAVQDMFMPTGNVKGYWYKDE